ncbi:MAG: hypothetical protein L0G69_05740 [Brevibacterium sp.]|nr:hypothetical protein [Brevibacterium sp.]
MPRQQSELEVLRRIALQSADLGILPNLGWVSERVAEHGYPYREIDGEQWLQDVQAETLLLRPTPRGKRLTFRSDARLSSGARHSFLHHDFAQTLERWHLAGPDNVPTPPRCLDSMIDLSHAH